jgi:hypothetical protein
VGERGGCLGFAVEALDGLGASEVARQDHLQSHVSIELAVLGIIRSNPGPRFFWWMLGSGGGIYARL